VGVGGGVLVFLGAGWDGCHCAWVMYVRHAANF